MNPANRAHSLHPAGNRPDPAKKPRSEAAGAANAEAPDPQHPPRRRRRLGLLIVMALLLMGVGQAAWPVIDISAIQQLIQTVQLAQDQLDRVTTARDALLGQVANFTGIWSDLTGSAYQLGENASSLTTEFSLTAIEAGLTARKTAEQSAWPTATDIQDAYAGEAAAVIQQVLDAHQAETTRRTAERNASYDAQIVIAEAGEFLNAIETTAGNQNSETTQGLGAQLDRQIAVSSSARDIAAKQLELAATIEHRKVQLEHAQSIDRANQRRVALAVRTAIQDALDQHEADFDATAFDTNLYQPVLPSY